MYSLQEKSLVLQSRVKTLAGCIAAMNKEQSNESLTRFGIASPNASIVPTKESIDGIVELVTDMANEIDAVYENEMKEKEEQDKAF